MGVQLHYPRLFEGHDFSGLSQRQSLGPGHLLRGRSVDILAWTLILGGLFLLLRT